MNKHLNLINNLINNLKTFSGIVSTFMISPLDDLPLPAWDIIHKKYPSMFSLLRNKQKMMKGKD